ncbi:MAG TPA: endonuclease [Bacteroidia bacterium]|nr:endonuclease [Bacteroidia bacterium]
MKKLITALFFFVTAVTIAQTTLPTSWSFTTTSFPTGWTASGNSYYTGSGNTPPACKFDNTGDWVQIFFSGAPGALSYYIAGNSFAGGTFDVQESVNGTTWTTLHSYSDVTLPAATYTQFTDNPSASSHYIRFYYTNKSSGNVGVDDVTLNAAPAGPQQEINVKYNSNTVLTGGAVWFSSPVSTMTPENFTIENQGTTNALNVSGATITGPDAGDFSIATSTPFSVNGLSSSTLTVNFTPSSAGTKTAVLTINNDDADESAYVINLYGVGGNYATEPSASATALAFTNVKSYRIKVNWTNASPLPDGYIVLRNDVSPVTDAPADGAGYSVGDQVGSCKVAYIGSGTSFWANYIGANENYYFAVFSYNGPVPYRNYLTSSSLSGSVTSSGSMQPANYYSTINTAAPTFVDDLTALSNPHTDNYYSNYGPRMVSLFWARDTSNGDKAVTCVYSGANFVYTEPFQWTVMSREHSYCHSWMPTYPSTTGPEYSDYFNLFPVDQNNANALRSNYPLGEVVNVTSTYLGCKYGTDANGHTVFEPRDEQKGDAARAIFYMAMCYNSASQNWGFPNPISASIMYGQDQNVLKKWNYQDPPDAREIAKNDFIDSLQGNRNPFIDSMNYVCYIDFNTMTKINGPLVPCNNTTIGMGENNPNRTQLRLWPNPTDGVFTLYYQTQENEDITIRLVDVSGRIVFEEKNSAAAGANAYALDLTNVSGGAYTLQVQGKNLINTELILQ